VVTIALKKIKLLNKFFMLVYSIKINKKFSDLHY
jgi:hypothetical protein